MTENLAVLSDDETGCYGPVTPNPTPLEFLEAVYTNEDLELPVRMRAAIAAAQYKHPKLAVQTNVNLDVGAILDQRRQRGDRLARARAEGRLIEAIRSGEIVGQVIEGEAQELPVSPSPVEHSAEELAKPSKFNRRV